VKRLEWYIARRYLASRGRGRFLSFITWIALGGVTVGVCALVVVIGVMNGMQKELRGKILGATPHILVLQQGASLRMDDWRGVMDSVRGVAGVEAAAPFALTQVSLLRRGPGGGNYVQSADLYGVSLEEGQLPITDTDADILSGYHDLRETASGLPPLLMGSRLARRMNVLVGDTVVLGGLENLRLDPMGSPTVPFRQFEVTGTVTTGMYDYDIRNLYAPLSAVQEILGIAAADQVGGVAVRLADPWAAPEMATLLWDHLGPPYIVETWIAQNQALFSALKLEKLAMGLILFLIVLVAAFNIVSTLVMVVVDRTREIGILKSMGMTDRTVLRVFMLQGLWIGIIGTGLGMTLGIALALALDRFRLIEIPPDVYFVDRLPVSLDPGDLGLIVLASVVVAFAATIYPALTASRLQPVEAIRHE